MTRYLCILLLVSLVYVYGQQCSNCPSLINIRSTGLRPEGLEWTQATNFLVSSLTYGTINKVSDTGALSAMISDNRLQSTLGLAYLSSSNQLLIANTNGTAAFNRSSCRNQTATRCVEASLIIANLGSGLVTAEVDFTPFAVRGTQPLANGVVADGNGNAFVTDSFQNQIYQVNINTGKVSSIMTSQLFKQGYGNGAIGLNGIEYSAASKLLIVSRSDNGQLYRINMTGNLDVREIKMTPIPGVDGIKFTPSGNLVTVSGSGRSVLILSSNDSWLSAKVINAYSTPYLSASSAAIRQGEVYIVHSHIEQPLTYGVYEIEKVSFSTSTSPSPRPSSFSVQIPVLNNRLVGDWQTRCIPTANGTSSMMYTLHIGGRSFNVKAMFYQDSSCTKEFGAYLAQGAFNAFNVTQPSNLPRLSGSFSLSNTPSLSVSASVSPSPGTLSPSRTPSVTQGMTHTPSPSAGFNGYIANDPALYVYIPGAYPADFVVTFRTLTPFTNEAAALYNSSGCGMSPFFVNTATALNPGSCALLGLANQSSAACPLGERDVLFYNSSSIFLGNRTDHVMCNLPRPTSLGEEFRCVTSSACGAHSKSGGSDRFSPDGKDIAIFVIVIVALLLCLCCLCILLIVLLIKG